MCATVKTLIGFSNLVLKRETTSMNGRLPWAPDADAPAGWPCGTSQELSPLNPNFLTTISSFTSAQRLVVGVEGDTAESRAYPVRVHGLRSRW